MAWEGGEKKLAQELGRPVQVDKAPGQKKSLPSPHRSAEKLLYALVDEGGMDSVAALAVATWELCGAVTEPQEDSEDEDEEIDPCP